MVKVRLKACNTAVYQHLETFTHTHAGESGWQEEWCKLQAPDGRIAWWLKGQLEVVRHLEVVK